MLLHWDHLPSCTAMVQMGFPTWRSTLLTLEYSPSRSFTTGDGPNAALRCWVSCPHWSRYDLHTSRMPRIQTHQVLLIFTPCLACVQLKRFHPMPKGEQGEERTYSVTDACLHICSCCKSHTDGKVWIFQDSSSSAQAHLPLLCISLPGLWCLERQWGRMERRTRACHWMPSWRNQEVFDSSGELPHFPLHRSCILCLCNTRKRRARRTGPWQRKQQIRSSPFSRSLKYCEYKTCKS